MLVFLHKRAMSKTPEAAQFLGKVLWYICESVSIAAIWLAAADWYKDEFFKDYFSKKKEKKRRRATSKSEHRRHGKARRDRTSST